MPDAEEDKPEPDLDELLDQFREPEEKPRRKAIPGSVWLMLALILAIGGVWLALRVASGAALASAAAGPMKPTKVSDRKAREEQWEAVDVLEDYNTRCKKGMSAQEVRWIVEDFQMAGLDEGLGSLAYEINALFQPPADLWKQVDNDKFSLPLELSSILERKGLKLARRQQKWYASALADGLRLTGQQRKELAESGDRFLAQRSGDFLKLENASWDARYGSGWSGTFLDGGSAGGGGGISGTQLLFPNTRLLEPRFWLEDEECAPWEMVQLTEAQSKVTRQDEVMAERRLLGSENREAEHQPEWMNLLQTRSDEELEIEVPRAVDAVAAIFPFVGEQHFPEDDDDLLEVVKLMHPAQLKMLLLLWPDRATELEEALEIDGE